MNTGGNLMKSPSYYLFNTFGPKDMGFYHDTVANQSILLLKRKGEHIPISTGVAAVGVNIAKISMQCHDEGAKKVSSVMLDDKVPCGCESYEYGVELRHSWKFPGIRNSELTPKLIYYGGTYMPTHAEMTAGVFNLTSILGFEEDIIKQIKAHTPMSTAGDGAYVTANRLYAMNSAAVGTPGVLSIIIGGTTTTFTATTAATLVMLINASAAVNGSVVAFYKTDPGALLTHVAHEFFILGKDGAIFTVTDTTTSVILSRSITIVDKQADIRHTAIINPSVSSVAGMNISFFKTLNASVIYCLTFTDSAGTETIRNNCPCGANLPFVFATTLLDSSLLTPTGFRATDIVGTGALLGIMVYNANSSAYIDALYETGYSYELAQGTQNGVYSTLTTDDVFREFATGKWNSPLARFEWVEKPIKGQEYCRIRVSTEQPIADLHGANYVNTRRGIMDIFIPKLNHCANLWKKGDANNDTPTAPNLTLTAVISAIAAGTVYTNVIT